MRSRAPFVLSLFSSLMLSACGGSSGTKVQPSTPIFTSAPVTAAAQGTPYSYALAATDPSGGAITYALTTSPTGATISGNTVSWTPSAAQSRTSNSFTATATTSSGGSATQSWTVSPSGIITVNWINTYHTPTGPLQVPIPAEESVTSSAVVPQPDGSILVLRGSTTAPGVISIAGVPAGSYWLTLGNGLISNLAASAYWTSTSTFDAGRDIVGSPLPALSPSANTQFMLDLSGLDSVASVTQVAFNPLIQEYSPPLNDPANSTTLSQTLFMPSNVDWTQVHTAVLTQYEPSTLGPLSNLVLGPEATLTGLSFTNGVTNTITQALQPSVPASVNLSIPGSQWAPLFQGTAPAAPTSYNSAFLFETEPYLVGSYAAGTFSGVPLVLTDNLPSPTGLLVPPYLACDATGFPTLILPLPQPGILTDQNLGALQYSDPFPANWTRAVSFCQEAIIPVAIPNSSATANFALVASETVAPSANLQLAPVAGTVGSPTIGGGSLYTSATLSTTTPTLSWSAPSGATPYGYRVSVYVQNTAGIGVPAYLAAGSFYTSQTSLTLTPLSGGNTYVFAITALVDGLANIQTSPFRSALPTGFASVVSAPITISSGAASAVIRGDASVVRRLSEPSGSQARHKRSASL